MTEKRIVKQHHATFEAIRHADETGSEFWQARELAGVLEYSQYRHFLPVVERAREACRNSGRVVTDHFEDVLTMVEIGSGAQREIEDVRLSRYACSPIAQKTAIRNAWLRGDSPRVRRYPLLGNFCQRSPPWPPP